MRCFTTIGCQKTGSHPFCQDYYKVIETDDSVTVLMADGHGGTPYCRSSLGARIAVYAAERLLSEGIPSESFPEALKDEYDRLTEKHLRMKPLSNAEKRLIGEKPERMVYGTTFMGVRITSDGKTALYHLGDGEIHLVDRNGRFVDVLGKDEDCFLNYTSSLSQARGYVIDHFRTAFLDELPAAVTVYTDGYKAPSGGHPWEAVETTLSETDVKEGLEKVLAKHETKDDQTFVLLYDSGLAKDNGYAKALMDTAVALDNAEKKQKRKKLLEDEYRKLDCFIQLAIPKEKRMKADKADGYNEFFEKLVRAYDRFTEIGRLLRELT